MQMTQEDLDEFILALLSDKFKQGRLKLKRRCLADQQFEHCCLGVLTELQAERCGIREVNWASTNAFEVKDPDPRGIVLKTDVDLLPPLMTKFACNRDGPHIPLSLLNADERQMARLSSLSRLRDSYSIAHLNDRGFTFERIAQLFQKVVVIIDNYVDRNVIFDPNGTASPTPAA